MATGRALCIGLNSVDPKHYQGWSGDLVACEADAEDMAAIARDGKFKKVTKLLTRTATRKRVIAEIRAAAKALKSGDLFMLTYSGHGGQLPDRNDDEPDGQDETWCLFDGELVDDELYALWSGFKSGVRVLVLSDSCHSGTVTRLLVRDAALRAGTVDSAVRPRDGRGAGAGRTALVDPTVKRYRAMPDEAALATYRRNRKFYDKILADVAKAKVAKPKATVRLVSGCQDNQLSQDGAFNGLFTGTLLKVWKNGAFKGDYGDFHRSILNRMPPDQSPNHFVIGQSNPAFDAQRPFQV